MTLNPKGVFNGIIEAGITISLAFPIANNVVLTIDRIMGLIQKAVSNKALCKFIGERLSYGQSILKSSKSIDKEVLERYSVMLNEIESAIKVISGNKQGFKAWILNGTKKIINAKEVNFINVVIT
jgi:hypothetical protein